MDGSLPYSHGEKEMGHRVRPGRAVSPSCLQSPTSVSTCPPLQDGPPPLQASGWRTRQARDCEPLGLVQALAGTPEATSGPWGGSRAPLRSGWRLAAGGRGAWPILELPLVSPEGPAACPLEWREDGGLDPPPRGILHTPAFSLFLSPGRHHILFSSATQMPTLIPVLYFPPCPNSDPVTFPWNISTLALLQCVCHTPPRGHSATCKPDHVTPLL